MIYFIYALISIPILTIIFKKIKSLCWIKNILTKLKFPKIIVSKNFEVKNGLLGLDRDVYLIVVKFLDSSIIRQV
jgi:hypothetical protein